MVVAQQLHHLAGIGRLGEGREAAQIAEDHRDLATVRGQHRLVAGREHLGDLR